MYMKNLIIFIVVLLSYQTYSQSFSATWNVGDKAKIVHLFVDTDFSSDAIVIKKEFVETIQGTSLQNDDLVLIGDFEAIGSNYILNYTAYKYYMVPFDPEAPIYILNNMIPSDITEGTLYLSNVVGSIGDQTYWCDCGGEGAPAAEPGGCVPQVGFIWLGGKVVRCVKDGDECKKSCIGTSSPHAGLSTNDGLIVQVPIKKELLFHNVKTRN